MNPPTDSATEAPQIYETRNGLSQQRRAAINALMNQRLADAVDLQMQMKQAHWNVKGPSFIGLHELFDKVSADVGNYVDMIAERITQLGALFRLGQSFVLLVMLLAGAATSPAMTITRVSSDIFHTDLGIKLECMYVAYQITNNDGTNCPSIYVTVSPRLAGLRFQDPVSSEELATFWSAQIGGVNDALAEYGWEVESRRKRIIRSGLVWNKVEDE